MRFTHMVLGLAIALPPRFALAEKDANAQFRAIMGREISKKANATKVEEWLNGKKYTEEYLDCGVGKDGVAVDPKTWEWGYLFEYYPADRGKPPTTPDFVPSCYDPNVPLCFRRNPDHPLEFDMARYAKWPDTNECGLTGTRKVMKDSMELDLNGGLYNGKVTLKMKYWERRTSYARIVIPASKWNAPKRARAGKVVSGLGYGAVVVDVYPNGKYLDKDREVELLAAFTDRHRRFCYTEEIVARSGPECAKE